MSLTIWEILRIGRTIMFMTKRDKKFCKSIKMVMKFAQVNLFKPNILQRIKLKSQVFLWSFYVDIWYYSNVYLLNTVHNVLSDTRVVIRQYFNENKTDTSAQNNAISLLRFYQNSNFFRKCKKKKKADLTAWVFQGLAF